MNTNKTTIKEALLKGERVTLDAILHSDFAMDAGILRIEKHDDKLVFRNPGLLRVPIEQIYEGGVSYARNPKIQNMLRMAGYGENLGSGFPLILDAWKQTGWILPELKNKIDLDEVELTLPVQREEDSTLKSSQKNSENTRESTQKSTLKSSQKSSQKSTLKSSQKIIELIITSPYITLSEIATLLGMTRRGVDKNIQKLKEQGIIQRVGSDKGGHWEIIEEK